MKHWQALIAMFVFIAIAVGANHFIKKGERGPLQPTQTVQVGK